jgi:DNA adenine methylase
MKPPFPYYGGKIRLADRISNLFPDNGHYVEPYAGSLSVLLAKPPSRMETVNDLDHAIINFWRVLRTRPDELERACALTPHSIAEFHASATFDDPTLDELERARRMWVRLSQGRSGRLHRTGWRHYVDTARSSTGMPGYLDGYVDRMAAVVERLHHVSLECRPALEVVEWYGRSADVLLYVDPPYLGSTRASDCYRHEMTGDEDHRLLAKALRDCAAAVVLSGYPSDLYDLELYPDWHRAEFASGTGQNAETWANRTEVLWSNRPLGAQLELFPTQTPATTSTKAPA